MVEQEAINRGRDSGLVREGHGWLKVASLASPGCFLYLWWWWESWGRHPGEIRGLLAGAGTPAGVNVVCNYYMVTVKMGASFSNSPDSAPFQAAALPPLLYLLGRRGGFLVTCFNQLMVLI